MRFLFFFLFIFAAAFAPAQSCYVRLEDASGFNTDAYQADLEAAACALRAAFPDTFQNKFKVYDFGFYLHQETFSGSYPEAFAQKIAQVNANPAVPYYLLFGKQTDASGVYTRFWVEVKLPNKGIFYCIDELSPNLRGDLTAKYGVIANIAYEANQKSLSRYYKAEMVAMDSLLAYVTALKTCCIPPEQGNRNGLSCSACAFTEAEFAARLNSFGMISKAFTKIIDTNPLANQGEDIGYEVEFNGSKIDLDDAITSIKNTIHNKFPEVSIKGVWLQFDVPL